MMVAVAVASSGASKMTPHRTRQSSSRKRAATAQPLDQFAENAAAILRVLGKRLPGLRGVGKLRHVQGHLSLTSFSDFRRAEPRPVSSLGPNYRGTRQPS